MHIAIMSIAGIRTVAGMAVITLLVSLSIRAAEAAVITMGDVTPADPSTWTTSTNATIGNTANGSVTVNGGSAVSGNILNLAMKPGVTGTFNVDGVNSRFSGGVLAGSSSNPQIFAGGTGIVNVTNGGTIANGVSVGDAFNSIGVLNITKGGRVNGGGGVGGSFRSTGVALVDGVGSQWNGGSLTIGGSGTGLLKVLNGASVTSDNGNVGRFDNGTGRTILDGSGSTWTVGASQLTIGTGQSAGGTGAKGLVTISNGATLSNESMARVGYQRAVGTVMVNGIGSSWASGTGFIGNGAGCLDSFPTSPVCGLNVGVQGTGHVSVSDGARLTTNVLYINNKSNLTMDLGTGSSVSVGGGTGALTNDGTIRLAAKATVANGTYAPITAGTWNGTGTVQALGGVYDPITHSVTVSSATTGQAGVATTIDRSVTQRMMITDSATGQQVGASFQAAQTPSNISLIASLMSPSQLSLLQGLLDPGKAVLGAWNFSATGYTQGDPVYLSMQVGPGQKFYDLDVWRFDGTNWAKYLNTDLAYDNKFASFVANGFSGYAISGLAAVPIPAAAWLFGSGLAALMGLARRNALMKGDTHT